MKSEKFEIKIESKADSLPLIANFVSDSLGRFKVDTETINKVQLAVEEACTNIIDYAYPDGAGYIKINLELDKEEILITIIDKGQPFNPTLAPPPDLNSDVEQRKIGGLGIFLMLKMMDKAVYSYDSLEGNKLVLMKHLLPRNKTSSG
jgi:serine/threonine-protein kinase RsbW